MSLVNSLKQRLVHGEGKSFLPPDKIPYIVTTKEYIHNVIRLKAAFTVTHSLFDVKVPHCVQLDSKIPFIFGGHEFPENLLHL